MKFYCSKTLVKAMHFSARLSVATHLYSVDLRERIVQAVNDDNLLRKDAAKKL